MDILTNKDVYAKTDKGAASPAKSFLVTDIRAGIKNENRVNVFLNNKFEFSLDISQVIDLNVKVGKTFSIKEVENLRKASEFGKLYQRTLEWVLTRPRSIKETKDYLKRKKLNRTIDNKRRLNMKLYKEAHESENPYKNPDNLDENGRLKFKNSPWAMRTEPAPEISDENINAVISRLIEKGYLSDQKFAQFFVENRSVKKGISERRLRQELTEKGVKKSDIDFAFLNSPRDETEEIKKIIAKKSKQYDNSKLINYLVRQGFDYQLVKSLVLEKD